MPPTSAFEAYRNTLKTGTKKKNNKSNQPKGATAIKKAVSKKFGPASKPKSQQTGPKKTANNLKKKGEVNPPKIQNKQQEEEEEDQAVLNHEDSVDDNIIFNSTTNGTVIRSGKKPEEIICNKAKGIEIHTKITQLTKRKTQTNVTATPTKKSKNPEKNISIAQNGVHSKKEKSTGSKNFGSTMSKLTPDKEKTTSPAPAKLPAIDVTKKNSITEGGKAFQLLINPMKLDKFFGNYWEQNALLVKRDDTKLYESLISFKAIDQMLLNNHVEFTKNIDVTSYENGVRQTHNPEGRALPPTVWDFYSIGCSVRLLNPQTFLKPMYELCATLQEYFHCLVGTNAYLTPPNSQGFAPHYDDIEAFVLQIEGRKRWKLYKPRTPAEALPRYSSQNFTQDEIGEPILEEVLKPGDLLYFPRGTIHQACTEPGYHSLHITLSVYQKQSYADLLEKMLPIIIQNAISANVNLRRGLPLNIWRNAGLVFNETDTQERAGLERKVTKIIGECLHSVKLTEVMDAAVDELAKKYQHEALPPYISYAEQQHTVFGVRNCVNANGECVPTCPINLLSNVRLLRANILRLISEEEQIRIYYYLDNSKEYCEYEPNFFEIEPELAGSIEILIKSYPEFVGVSQLPLEDDESKIELAVSLWKRGLIMTKKPIEKRGDGGDD